MYLYLKTIFINVIRFIKFKFFVTIFCLKISNRLSISNFMINQKIKLTFQKSQFSTKGRNNGNETTSSTVTSSRCRADGRSAFQSSLTKGVTHVYRG